MWDWTISSHATSPFIAAKAVHLEVAASLDLSSFLIAFASFTARRGRPSVVYSDNEIQIVAGDKAIQQGIERLKEQNIVGQTVKQEIEWHISPPLAPHFGGVWESLVKSAKVALEAIGESRPLTEELLRGFVIQAESLLNGTYFSVDPRDPEPLTPNHFLLAQSSQNSEDDFIEDEKLCSRKHWEAMQVMTTHLWRRWLQEYLPTLTDRRKWLFDKKNLAVEVPCSWWPRILTRGHWPVGRIHRSNHPNYVLKKRNINTNASDLQIMDIPIASTQDQNMASAGEINNDSDVNRDDDSEKEEREEYEEFEEDEQYINVDVNVKNRDL
ncbi:uncharacterized protein LOC116932481 [Daphnia magna]|nr:uncharacterized protein LOC116932481 [Daphnia magna]